MNMKDHILTALREQFNRWEELLASVSEEQIARLACGSLGKLNSPGGWPWLPH